jgi:hypothetical protein
MADGEGDDNASSKTSLAQLATTPAVTFTFPALIRIVGVPVSRSR